MPTRLVISIDVDFIDPGKPLVEEIQKALEKGAFRQIDIFYIPEGVEEAESKEK